MPEIKVYYEESIIYQKNDYVRLEADYDLFNASNCYVIVGSVKYYFNRINFDNTHMYIIHVNSDSTKTFIFQIELSTTDKPEYDQNVSRTEYKDFFKNFDSSSTSSDPPKTSLNLRGFINDVIKDPSKITVKRDNYGKLKHKILMVNVGKKLLVNNTDLSPKIDTNYIDVSKITTDYPDASVSIETKKGSIVQKCVRKGSYGEKVDADKIQDMTESLVKTRSIISISVLSFFFILIFTIIVSHFTTKHTDTDFFGNSLPHVSGGGKISGGSCSIPDLGSIQFRIPTPSILGYFKMSAFLLFLNMMIFGGNPVIERNLIHNTKRSVEEQTNDRQAFIGVGIAVIVIVGIVILIYKNQQRSILDGITPINLLLYSPDTIAIYPAVMSYLVFYTNFIKLVENKVELPEFLLFMLSFIVLSGYAMYASYNEENSFRSPSFIIMIVILAIIVLSIGYVMKNDPSLNTQDDKDKS